MHPTSRDIDGLSHHITRTAFMSPYHPLVKPETARMYLATHHGELVSGNLLATCLLFFLKVNARSPELTWASVLLYLLHSEPRLRVSALSVRGGNSRKPWSSSSSRTGRDYKKCTSRCSVLLRRLKRAGDFSGRFIAIVFRFLLLSLLDLRVGEGR